MPSECLVCWFSRISFFFLFLVIWNSMQCNLIILTLHYTNTQSPLALPLLSSLCPFPPSGSICVAQITYKEHDQFIRFLSFFSPALSFLLNIVNTFLAFGGITLNSFLHGGIRSGLGLSGFFVCCCNGSDFWCASAMLYQMIILPCSNPLPLALLLFLSPLFWWSQILEEGMSYICFIQG